MHYNAHIVTTHMHDKRVLDHLENSTPRYGGPEYRRLEAREDACARALDRDAQSAWFAQRLAAARTEEEWHDIVADGPC